MKAWRSPCEEITLTWQGFRHVYAWNLRSCLSEIRSVVSSSWGVKVSYWRFWPEFSYSDVCQVFLICYTYTVHGNLNKPLARLFTASDGWDTPNYKSFLFSHTSRAGSLTGQNFWIWSRPRPCRKVILLDWIWPCNRKMCAELINPYIFFNGTHILVSYMIFS